MKSFSKKSFTYQILRIRKLHERIEQNINVNRVFRSKEFYFMSYNTDSKQKKNRIINWAHVFEKTICLIF